MKKDHNLNRCSSLCTKVGLLLIGFLPNTAFSLPAGGEITAGDATIISNDSDNVLNVNQSSEKLFIDWDSFDIDADETVNFNQESHYIALNRISNSGQLTTINGNLNANGSVFIINPNGVLINGNVDTNSFIATTAGIDPDDFINNANADFAFTEAGELDSSVETGLDSKISVSENGKAILVAPTVKNAGLIEGKIIQLAAADSFSIDFDGDGLLSFELSTPDTQSRSLLNENIGTLRAEGGKAMMTAATANDIISSSINTSGVIEAKSLSSSNGEIVLGGTQADITVSGTLDVSGNESAGTIHIGSSTSSLDAIDKAKSVEVKANTMINADSIENGNGGNVKIEAKDELILYAANISAKAGTNSGNGGTINTQSDKHMYAKGTKIDTSATNGNYGNWIIEGANEFLINTSINSNHENVSSASKSKVLLQADVLNQAASNIMLFSDTNLVFNSDINLGNPGVSFLAFAGDLEPDTSNLIEHTISLNGEDQILSFDSNEGNITLKNFFIRTNGGDVTLVSGNYIKIKNSTIFTRGGDFSAISGQINFEQNTSSNSSVNKIDTNGGDVLINAVDKGNTDGDLNITHTTYINTTDAINDSSGSAGDFNITKNGNDIAPEDQFNSSDIIDNSENGGNINIIAGKIIDTTAICFAAGGSQCAIDDPIAQQTIVIELNDTETTYGTDAVMGWTLAQGTIADGDEITGEAVRIYGNDVGTYEILQGSLNLASNFGNYILEIIAGNYVINKAPLTITAENKTITYGEEDVALTFTAGSGFQFDDTIEDISGTLTRETGTDAGSYSILQGNLAAANYELSFTEGVYQITPASLTVTADSFSKKTGQRDPAFTYTSYGLIGNDTLTGSLSRVANESAGLHEILLGTLSAGSNYNLEYTGGYLTIVSQLTQPQTVNAFNVLNSNVKKDKISYVEKNSFEYKNADASLLDLSGYEPESGDDHKQAENDNNHDISNEALDCFNNFLDDKGCL